jgi:hypothetical protein
VIVITASPRVDVLREDVDTVDGLSSVPEIVPASFQNRASGANSSQVARSRKCLKREDLRGKTTLAEMLIGV